ncbi:MAG: RTX toxin, partial [Gammaproteobacteria bacterium]|nr:RTX toxin [Gammaproteobacteria bacterium]
MVNLAGYFTDPDGDALTYGATSSDVTIASVAVSGSVLTITGVAAGAATVTVTATDGGGLSAQQSFAVTVPNRAPEAVGEIGDLEIAVDSVAELDVAGYFADPDGDELEFGAASSDTTRARVAVSGSVMTITGVAAGSAAVTVTATDGGGLSAQQ